MDPEEANTWAAYLDKVVTRVVIGEVLIIESKSI